jgi:hypothetical protein
VVGYRRIVLFETASNQRFIFDTNRRALAVGASDLTRLSTTQWVRDALAELGLPTDWDPAEARGLLLESSGSTVVVLDASGPDDEGRPAHDLARLVTIRALRDAPGLRIFVASSPPFAWSEPGSLHAANATAHLEVAEARHRIPDAATRFQRLPWVAECLESGLPATVVSTVGRTDGPCSAMVIAKHRQARNGYRNLRRIALNSVPAVSSATSTSVPNRERGMPLASAADELDGDVIGDEDERWVAVIHADGNGVGQLFLAFDEACGHDDNSRYATALRGFSAALNEATRMAFLEALGDLETQLVEESDAGSRPGDLVLPIVLAGDDLTCVVTGRRAVRFSVAYLRAFARLTSADSRVTSLSRQSGSGRVAVDGIGAAAGIAVTKSHFPFWQAYRLAEQLCASAKTAKRLGPDTCSLDVHVLFDSTVSDLEQLRSRASSPSGSVTWGGPYLLDVDPSSVTGADSEWAAAHDFDSLADAVAELSGGRDEPTLPSTVTHRMREALLRPTGSVEAVLDDLGLRARRLCRVATGSEDHMFVSDGSHELTRLVDAMTLADLGAGTSGGVVPAAKEVVEDDAHLGVHRP